MLLRMNFQLDNMEAEYNHQIWFNLIFTYTI